MQLVYCIGGPLHSETRTAAIKNKNFIGFPIPKDPYYSVAIYKVTEMKTLLKETIIKFAYSRERKSNDTDTPPL